MERIGYVADLDRGRRFYLADASGKVRLTVGGARPIVGAEVLADGLEVAVDVEEANAGGPRVRAAREHEAAIPADAVGSDLVDGLGQVGGAVVPERLVKPGVRAEFLGAAEEIEGKAVEPSGSRP